VVDLGLKAASSAKQAFDRALQQQDQADRRRIRVDHHGPGGDASMFGRLDPGLQSVIG
jgi:hypothetical protein